MLCPDAVSMVAVAGLLLAVLNLGLSLPAEDDSLCGQCFYRLTPPRGASAGPPLRPLCHALPGGQAFATLYSPTCDTAAYSAFRLSHGWAESGGEEEKEPVEETGEDGFKVLIPALLGGGTSALSPPQRWDSLITALVRSSISPQCDATGGDLYILTGTGAAQAAADGDEKGCKAGLLWSAVCCAGPEGAFSVGLITETDGGERAVSVRELEEILGVTELFTDGCGATDGQTGGDVVGILGEALAGIKATEGSDITDDETDEEAESRESPVVEEQVAHLDTQPEDEEGDSAGDQEEEAHVQSDYDSSSGTLETAESESNSTLLYIISSSFYLLTAPVRCVFSTVIQFPGQVAYVLQENLCVLFALPVDTCSLFYLVTSDLASWVRSAADLLLSLGEYGFSGIYHCTSSVLEALYTSCHTGVTGVGTLAGDTVGIVGGAVDNVWWVTRLFGGRLWEHGEGYVGAVVSEAGGQARAVGGGLGKLVWRSGRGVGNVVGTGGGFVMGTVEAFVAAVREAFGEESE